MLMGTFVFPEYYPLLAGREGVVVTYLIRHPEATVLFDTGIGFGSRDIADDYQPRTRRLDDALADVGASLGEISALINCHLHFDHVGQNNRLPNVPIYAQPAEWEAAHGEDYTILDWVDFEGANYQLHEGDYELLPGITVLATPGHTPGHQSLVVDTADGSTVLAGQACFGLDEWEGRPTPSEGATSAADRGQYEASLARLRALHPARVYFGHEQPHN
jgi:N-acyl homoserine lactone hydrolase